MDSFVRIVKRNKDFDYLLLSFLTTYVGIVVLSPEQVKNCVSFGFYFIFNVTKQDQKEIMAAERLIVNFEIG